MSFGSWWDYTGGVLDFWKSERVHSNLADQWIGKWGDCEVMYPKYSENNRAVQEVDSIFDMLYILKENNTFKN